MSETKPFIISKDQVMKAFQLIKANKGAAGVDQQSLKEFELNKKLRGHKTRVSKFIEGISKRQPTLFVHWKLRMIGSFA